MKHLTQEIYKITISSNNLKYGPVQTMSSVFINVDQLPNLVEKIEYEEDVGRRADKSRPIASVYLQNEEGAKNFKTKLENLEVFDKIKLENQGILKDNIEKIVKILHYPENNHLVNREAFLGYQHFRKII